MGTILFLVLKYGFGYNTVGYDWVILCVLVSLDSIAAPALMKMCPCCLCQKLMGKGETDA